MGRYLGPKHKHCRAEGIPVCGLATCPVIRKNAGLPGQHGAKGRRKMSDYGIQLREKQKVKRMYGLLEKQFKKYYEMAARKKTATGEALLGILESRLDNVVYRLGLAASRRHARQLVSHGHVTVNNQKVTIPSFSVKMNDIITLSPKASNLDFIKKLQEVNKDAKIASWLEKKALVGKIKSEPVRQELDFDVNETLIVEYYSR